MKKNLINNILRLLIPLLIIMSGCNRDQDHDHQTYTCPMHPTVISDKPGACPVCGMDLVLQARKGDEAVLDKEVNAVLESTNEVVLSDITTINPLYETRDVPIVAPGIVTYDPKNINAISTRVGGRLEAVELKYPYQAVRKGELVAEIYSPDLLAAQRELLFLEQNDSGNEDLIKAARRKLQLLGLTETQVLNIIKNGKPEESVRIFSPYSGYVVPEAATAAPTANPNGGAAGGGMASVMGGSDMNSSTSPTPATDQNVTASLIREGSYVSKGQTLFRIVNNSALRIELEVEPGKAGLIRRGHNATITTPSGEELKGKVDFVQPFYGDNTTFPKVRITINNHADLPIGQLVEAKLDKLAVEGLWIPREAVVDLGNAQVVFTRKREAFVPTPVETGFAVGQHVYVKKGLTSSDEIAANGQYLLDSESLVKTQK